MTTACPITGETWAFSRELGGEELAGLFRELALSSRLSFREIFRMVRACIFGRELPDDFHLFYELQNRKEQAERDAELLSRPSVPVGAAIASWERSYEALVFMRDYELNPVRRAKLDTMLAEHEAAMGSILARGKRKGN